MFENDNQYPNDVNYGNNNLSKDRTGAEAETADSVMENRDAAMVYTSGNAEDGFGYGNVRANDEPVIRSTYHEAGMGYDYGDSGRNTNAAYAGPGAGYRNENAYTGYEYHSNDSGQYGQAQQFSYTTSTPEGMNGPETKAKKTKKTSRGTGKRVMKLVGSGLVFGAVAGAAIVGILYFSPVKLTQQAAGQQAAVPMQRADQIEQSKLVETSATVTSAAVVTDVSDVVEEVMPSVVSITGLYKVETPYNPFGGYFGFGGMDQEEEEEGSGSGIIVGKNDEELLIATNNHVVEDATSLSVQFIDGESYDAQVKGTESDVDLAVIAVPLTSIKDATFSQIKIANLGDSDALKVGEPAITIGNALGYGQSVTTGVISAVNREYTQDNTTNYLIQTDAAINPGNSGGALINIRGEVVGINSNKIAGSAVEGMGYAIPISTAKPIIEELMTKTTRVKVDEQQKAFLGISGINVTEDVQNTYGLPEGIYIAQVYENTAAAKAGLTKGDILVQFDGEKVKTLEELTSLLEYYQKGTTVDIVIMQGSPSGYQEKTITVTLGGRTDS